MERLIEFKNSFPLMTNYPILYFRDEVIKQVVIGEKEKLFSQPRIPRTGRNTLVRIHVRRWRIENRGCPRLHTLKRTYASHNNYPFHELATETGSYFFSHPYEEVREGAKTFSRREARERTFILPSLFPLGRRKETPCSHTRVECTRRWKRYDEE